MSTTDVPLFKSHTGKESICSMQIQSRNKEALSKPLIGAEQATG